MNASSGQQSPIRGPSGYYRGPLALRLTVALAVGTLVAGCSLVAVWLDMSKAPGLRRDQWQTQQLLEHLGKSVGWEAALRDSPPKSLDGLGGSVPVADAWGRPFVYEVQGTNFLIRSYGRDGKPGGSGADADLSNWNLTPPEAQVPPSLYEFAFQLPLTKSATLATVACGVLAALMTFYTVRIPRLTRAELRDAAWKLAVTFLAASFIGWLIAALHVPHH